MAEAAAKVIKALNNKKQPQTVPRSVLEVARANDDFQQTEVRNSQIDPTKTSDPVATNQLAKAVVDIQDAADRHQDITELLQQYVNNVMANTSKAIACQKKEDHKGEKRDEQAKRGNSARKHESSSNSSLEEGGDDSVEKFYYSEFTEGSTHGKQELEPKTHHNRKQDFKGGLPLDKRKSKGGKSSDKRDSKTTSDIDSSRRDSKKSIADPKHRKSQLKQLEERVMRDQDDTKGKRPERYKTLKDEAEQEKYYGSLDRNRNSENEGEEERSQDYESSEVINRIDDDDVEEIEHTKDDDDILNERRKSRGPISKRSGIDTRKPTRVMTITDNNEDDDTKGPADNKVADEEHLFKSTNKSDGPQTNKGLDEKRNPTFNYIPENEKEKKNRGSDAGNVTNNRNNHDEDHPNDEKVYGDQPQGLIKEEYARKDAQKDKKYESGTDPKKGSSEDKEYVETASRRFSKKPADSSRSGEKGESIEYFESDNKRNKDKPNDEYHRNDGQHSSEMQPRHSTKNPENLSSKQSSKSAGKDNSQSNEKGHDSNKEKDPIHREEYIETASRRKSNGPQGPTETLETAYRKNNKTPGDKDSRAETNLESFNYVRKDQPKNKEGQVKEEENIKKDPRKSNMSSTPSSPETKKSVVQSGKYEENGPLDKAVREGEIIVAELEEGKTGSSKIRFSVIDPLGRKSVIDNRHVINPHSEFGEEFYKSINSSKKSAEFSSDPKKPTDPVAAAMYARKSVVRDRLVLPLLEDDEESQESEEYSSEQPQAPVPKRLVILDGRPREPELIDKEVVVFAKDAISRSLQNQKPAKKEQAVERINPMISDPNIDQGKGEEGKLAKSPPKAFIPPIERPKNYDEKRKTFFIEDKEKIGEDVLPCLIELDYMYFKNQGEPNSESETEKLHPLDPFESFYQECDQAKRNVPKIGDSKVFKRKVRKLKPEEQREAEKEKLEIAKLLRNPSLVPCESLERTQEWANGKPVYKKRIEFIPTKNTINKDPAFLETKLEYYQLIEKNPEFTDSIMYPEQAAIRSYKPKQPDSNFNAFDSLNRSELVSPVKFLLGQGPDGTIRIYQLEYFEGNPLIETEAGRLSLPTNIESSQDGFKTMYRHSGNFNDSPVLEPQTSRILDASTLGVPNHRNSEIQQLADRRILGPEELARFLEMMKFVPDAKIELYKQSPEEIKGKSIVEQGMHFNSMAYTDRASILKQIGELQRQGKIVSVDHQSKPKVSIEESIKLSALHSDDKTRKSFLQEPKISAIKLEDTYQDKPLFQILDKKEETGEDEEGEQYDPVTHLKEELEKVNAISDAQVPFSDISNKALATTDDVKAQKKILKKLVDELEQAAKQKGQNIEDWMFLPNGTSMVNNSLKSEIPYKDCDWMKLSELYKVDTFQLAKRLPLQLFPKGVVPTRRKVCKACSMYGCLE